MKLLLILLIAFCICSCNTLTKREEAFIIREYSIKSDTTLNESILYNNHYYCLSNNKHFTVLNNKFIIDTIITSKINKQQFDFAFLHNDSLLAGRFNDVYSTQGYFLSNGYNWVAYKHKTRQRPFFEDDKYIARACCVGEFGGSISFQEKGAENVYSLPATCAVAVNKLNDQYYVTTSLAHGSGFTKIFQVSSPKELFNLKVIKPDSLRHFCNWAEILRSTDKSNVKRKDLEVRATVLLDTMGMETLNSFTLNNKLYHINYSSNYTTIGKIEAKRMLTIDTLNHNATWSYQPRRRQYQGIHIYSFANREASGFIVINKDTLSTVLFH